jgi:hypothetical protein
MTSCVFVLLYTTNEGSFLGGIIPSCRNTWTYDYTCSLWRSEYGDFRHRNIMSIQNTWHYIGIKNILYDNKVILQVASNPELYVRPRCFVGSVLLFGLVIGQHKIQSRKYNPETLRTLVNTRYKPETLRTLVNTRYNQERTIKRH